MQKNDIKAIYNTVAAGSSTCICENVCGEEPDEANLGLSCGNPVAIAGLKEGETVLDLGSGAGFDCFQASSRVKDSGKVIGIDFSPDMIQKANSIARRRNIRNTAFIIGDIENIPVDSETVDLVMSNCVLNLVSDKESVFREIFRVLKKGGRIAISDIALSQPLPDHIQHQSPCLFSAITVTRYESMLSLLGYGNIRFVRKNIGSCFSEDAADPLGASVSRAFQIAAVQPDAFIVNVDIQAIKP